MNPWQEIPLADYEAHMNAAAVNQSGAPRTCRSLIPRLSPTRSPSAASV